MRVRPVHWDEVDVLVFWLGINQSIGRQRHPFVWSGRKLQISWERTVALAPARPAG